MERKVARASGKRTHDEQNDIQEEMTVQNAKKEKIVESHKLLDSSIKKIDIDLWGLERDLGKLRESMLN